jgi:hypothetical protein
MTMDGETITVVSLYASQIRPVGRREIAHVRTIEQGGAYEDAPPEGSTPMQKLALSSRVARHGSPACSARDGNTLARDNPKLRMSFFPSDLTM